MTKVYEHAVIYDGVLYPANTPIKVKDEQVTVSKTETVKKPIKKAVKSDDNA